MKKSVILDIFNGERGHRETMRNKERNDDFLDIADETSKELKEKLSPELHNILEKYIHALDCELLEEVDFYFAEGFKLGLLIGIECKE